MLSYALAVLLLALAVIVYFSNRRSRATEKGKARQLRCQIRQLLRQEKPESDHTIDRYIKSLQNRYPGHTEEWYLDKILYDLQRDR